MAAALGSRPRRRVVGSFGVVVLSLSLGACSSSGSGGGAKTGVVVTDAWARSTASLAQKGAVYMTLESPTADALLEVSVEASVAANASMHESMTDGAMMTMEPLERVELPAGTEVVFEPAKKHVMLDGLAKPLVAGATFVVHLRFDRAPALDATVTVRD